MILEGKKKIFILLMFMVILLFFGGSQIALGAKIKWRTQPFKHVSENQPIDEFIRELFIDQSVVVSISDKVKGQTISGRFEEPPGKVYKRIADAFDLISYYDGNIFYILCSKEVSSRIISLKYISTHRFKQILNRLNIPDALFPIRYYEQEGLVHAFGPAPYLDLIEETAKLMDTSDKARDFENNFSIPKTVRVFRLKNAWAQDRFLNVSGRKIKIEGVAAILQGLIQGQTGPIEMVMPTEDEPVADDADDPDPDRLVRVNLRKKLPNPLNEMGKLLHENTKPAPTRKSDNNNGVVVQAAERLNAVVIKDSYLNMPYYQMVIDQLDVPLQLVEIKAAIVDISSDAIKSLGVDWEGKIREQDFQVFGSSRVSQPKKGYLFNPIGQTADGLSLGTILGQFADDFFLAKVNAMESEGKAKIISRPAVITFDNIEANFKHTDTFYVRVAGERDVGLYEISTGIVLNVTPHVITENNETKIQLIVNIEDGTVTDKSVDNIPVLKNSNINTQAIVDENSSLLIGGLIHEQRQTIKNKVPILGDIPLLGAMFRYNDQTNSKMERLFLISPRIVESRSTEMAKNSDEISPDSMVRGLPDNLPKANRQPDLASSKYIIFTFKL